MAKLYFRYGTVGSAKTLNLLAVDHNYSSQGKKAILIQPAIDTRFGAGIVKSRAGLKRAADIVLENQTNLLDYLPLEAECLLVDEVQFLTVKQVEALRVISSEHAIPVICYGLRTDFRRELFEGSKRLLELCDSIEEIKTTCYFCNRKAVFNLKLVDGLADISGESIELGCEEKYLPACSPCYSEQLTLAHIQSKT